MVWEKFCRYLDVEPRIIPLAEGTYTIGPDDVAPYLDENTIGVAAVLGTTFTGHLGDIVGINPNLRAGAVTPSSRVTPWRSWRRSPGEGSPSTSTRYD